MDLRPPEGFVDVDVPEPRHRSLVEQRSLDRCAAAFESLCEPPRRERTAERLDPEALFEIRLELACFQQLPGAEAADVAISDGRSVVESDNSASVRIVGERTVRRVPEAPCHPEVNQQSPPGVEPNDQILATTFEG